MAAVTAAARREANARAPIAWRTPSAPLAAITAVPVLCGWVALAAATGRAPWLVPAASGPMPDWLAGPLRNTGATLSHAGFGAVLVVGFAAYVVAVTGASGLSARALVAAIVASHLAVALAPPLLSADVFGYLGYARLGLGGLSPYTHGAAALGADPVRAYIRWRDTATPYGPLFTLASYPLGLLGPAGGLWSLKALAALASLGTVAIVARCAAAAGRSPRRAAALVGLNPIVLLYAVGGAHNDLLLGLLMVWAIALAQRRREGVGAATAVLAVAVKASAGIALAFLIVGSRRRRTSVTGAAAAAVAIGALAVAAFGPDTLALVHQLTGQQGLVAQRSVPREIAAVMGFAGLPPSVRVTAVITAAAATVAALVRTARGADPVAAAGWVTLALLLATAWLLPWYVVWLVALAALGTDRRLELAALGFTAYLVASRTPFLLG